MDLYQLMLAINPGELLSVDERTAAVLHKGEASGHQRPQHIEGEPSEVK